MSRSCYSLCSLTFKFLVVVFISLLPLCCSLTTCDEDEDCTATLDFLLDLGRSFSITSWKGPDFCIWDGITCEGWYASVNLSGRGLEGAMPQLNVDHLDHALIHSVDLSNNPRIGGELNDHWFDLKHLLYFNISGTSVSGTIDDDIKDMQYLEAFDISSTLMYGTLPGNMKKLEQLKILDVSDTLMEGTIPSSFCSGMGKLEELLIGNTRIEGSLKDITSTSCFPNLVVLDWRNRLDNRCYRLPSSLVQWVNSHSRLKEFTFSCHSYHGCVPESFKSVPILVDAVYKCNMAMLSPALCNTGWCSSPGKPPEASTTYAFLKDLISAFPLVLRQHWTSSDYCTWRGVTCSGNGGIEVDLSTFDLSGSLPQLSERESTLVSSISFKGTKLSGMLPDNLGNVIPYARKLDFSNTNVYGGLPRAWSSFLYLKELFMSSAKLCVGLPDWNGSNFRLLTTVDLSNNRMNGPLASSWSTLYLTSLALDGNNFCGCAPESWKTLPVLSSQLALYPALSGSTCEIVNSCGTVNEQCSNADRSTHKNTLAFLQTLKNSFPSSLESWTGDNYCANWRGVSCRTVDGVEGVDIALSSAGLAGNLPQLADSTVGDSVLVWSIDLSNNLDMGGLLPVSWGKLSRLQTLKLYSTRLYGEIPDAWSGMHRLQYLDLSNDMLCRGLPNWSADDMPFLKVIDLTSNSLLGSLSSSFGSFGKQLTRFSVSADNFCGCIPSTWTAPILLKAFADTTASSVTCKTLDKCVSKHFRCFSSGSGGPNTIDPNVRFLVDGLKAGLKSSSGYLDKWQSHTEVDYCAWAGVSCPEGANGFEIDLSGGKVEGTLPDLSDLDECLLGVTSIDLSNNPHLEGSLPTAWENVRSLKRLNLSFTSISYTIPPTWENMNSIESLSLSNTLVCGPLPSWNAANMPSLSALDLSNNELSGTLTSSWGSFASSNLSSLDLAGNDGLCDCVSSQWSSGANLYTAATNLFGFTYNTDCSTCAPSLACVQPGADAGTSRPASRDNTTKTGHFHSILFLLLLVVFSTI